MSKQTHSFQAEVAQLLHLVTHSLYSNPEHPLVKKLDGSVHFHDLANILFDQAVLAEGGMPEDPAAYVKRVNALLA